MRNGLDFNRGLVYYFNWLIILCLLLTGGYFGILPEKDDWWFLCYFHFEGLDFADFYDLIDAFTLSFLVYQKLLCLCWFVSKSRLVLNSLRF